MASPFRARTLAVQASVLVLVLGARVAAADDDADGDGYTVDQGDCDDQDPRRSLGHPEACDDQLDNDCDGAVDYEDHDCLAVAEEASGIVCECDFPDPPEATAVKRRTGIVGACLAGVLWVRRARPRRGGGPRWRSPE